MPPAARRHPRAPDGSMVVRAARPAIRHREPAGRRHQYRHRGGRACAARRLYAPRWSIRRTRSTQRSTKSSISISSATSRRSRASSACPMSWWCIRRFRPRRFPSSSPMPKPIQARSTWRRAATGAPSHVAGELFKMMAGVDMVHVPYRGAAPALTDLLGGQVQVLIPPRLRRIEHIRAGKLRALAVTTAHALRDAAGRADVSDSSAGLRGKHLVRHRRAQEHTRRDRRQAQSGINAVLADP